MKECNIPFCKEIPDTWKEVPNRYLFEYHSVKVGEKWNDYQLLSLTTGGVKEKDINASGGKVPDSYDKYQTVEPGDMIFCLFDLDVSAVFSGLSHNYGMITSAYDVVRPNHKILNQNFSDFWFQYVFTNRYYKMYSKNIRFTIGSDMFKAISTPIPPMDQQHKIADFLNKKTAEIDSLIEIENQQIEKLKEYKQAIIVETVTKGLDNNALMKDSGVGWFKSIPYNCKIVKLKYLLENNDGGTWGDDPQNNENDKFVLRSTEQTIDGEWNIIEPAIRSLGRINKLQYYKVKPGDLLLTKSSGSKLHIGKTTLADESFTTKEYYYSNFLQRLHTNEKVLLNKFLWYFLNCPVSREQFVYMQNSTSGIGNINAEDLDNLIVVLPSIQEQRKIVDYLYDKCHEINFLITIKNKKIDTLYNYKKSLIYEYVTGKKGFN